MKALCKKQISIIISYHNYKNFNNSAFKEHLELNLEKSNFFEYNLNCFQDSCTLIP